MITRDLNSRWTEASDTKYCRRSSSAVAGSRGDNSGSCSARSVTAAVTASGSAAQEEAGNRRNGYGQKVITETGKLELSIPRGRHGRFDPVLIGKYRRRFAGLDEKIIALDARGVTTRGPGEDGGGL